MEVFLGDGKQLPSLTFFLQCSFASFMPKEKSEKRPFSVCFLPSPPHWSQFYWRGITSEGQKQEKSWHTFEEHRNVLRRRK